MYLLNNFIIGGKLTNKQLFKSPLFDLVNGLVAQPGLEHHALNVGVAGSSPVGAIY